MMRVEAIIRSEKLDDVKDAMVEAGFVGMTVCEVRGRGRQKGYVLNFRGKSINVDLLTKLKIELIVDEINVEKAIETLATSAFTGEIGDGKIFISPVADVIRIRTGERGKQAV